MAREIPLVGFYLQPAVGGIELPREFWRRFAAIDNVVAIKMAPFNRYRTLDVMRGVVEARAEERITLYTGNDDHIVLDLLTPFTSMRDGEPVTRAHRGRAARPLVGVDAPARWSCWQRIQAARARGAASMHALLALDAQVTDCNCALFDVAHNFHGCIAGCHEVLRRQGLLEGIWCLDPDEGLSPGQAAEIDRVCAQHGDLRDDAFVARTWSAGSADAPRGSTAPSYSRRRSLSSRVVRYSRGTIESISMYSFLAW